MSRTARKSRGRNREDEIAVVRNLDQIQEAAHGTGSSRVSALVMASFGGAVIVFAALALMRSKTDDAAERSPEGLGSGRRPFPRGAGRQAGRVRAVAANQTATYRSAVNN